MNNKIDLSAYMLSDEDALSHARLSVRDDTIEKAVKMIAGRNERTSEQAVIVAQQEEIARLRAELEAARVDAERYREVRSDITRGGVDVAICRIEWGKGLDEGNYKVLTNEDADAAIDAARGGK